MSRSASLLFGILVTISWRWRRRQGKGRHRSFRLEVCIRSPNLTPPDVFVFLRRRRNEFVLVALHRTLDALHQWLQTSSPAAYPAWSDSVEGSLCAGSGRARFSAPRRRTSRSTPQSLLCHIF